SDAMFVDVSTPETRKTIYSISYWTLNLAFGIGSIIGAVLYSNYFFHVLLSACVLSLSFFFIYWFLLEETKPQKTVKAERFTFKILATSYRTVAKNPLFIRFFVFSTALMVLEFQLSNFIAVRLEHEFTPQTLLHTFEITGIHIYGLLRTENTLLVVILALVVRRITNRMADHLQLLVGICLFTFGFAVVAVTNDLYVLLLATFVFTLGEMLYVPIKQAVLAVIVDEHARSQYMTVYHLHFRLALCLAALMLSVSSFISSIGMAVGYVLIGLVALLLVRSILGSSVYQNSLAQASKVS
ncbi:MAG: MFS transporter, partial [Bacilli bacterium]